MWNNYAAEAILAVILEATSKSLVLVGVSEPKNVAINTAGVGGKPNSRNPGTSLTRKYKTLTLMFLKDYP